MGTVNVKVCGSDFVPLWDGTVMRRSLAEHKLLEAHTSEEVNLEHILVASANLMNRCETCVLFGSLKINLAAAFWINFRGLMELAGRPAKRDL